MNSRDNIGRSQGNYYTTAETFPAYTPNAYNLHGGERRSLELDTPLPAVPTVNRSSSSKFIFNADYPVPTIGGNNLFIPCGPIDQSPLNYY